MLFSEAQTFRGGSQFSEISPTSLPLVDKVGANLIVREIARRRRQVVVPLFLCSFATYVATLIALSYFPHLVGSRIFGAVNLAYVLALAQFVINFLTAMIYALWARRAIDPLVSDAFAILARAATTGDVR